MGHLWVHHEQDVCVCWGINVPQQTHKRLPIWHTVLVFGIFWNPIVNFLASKIKRSLVRLSTSRTRERQPWRFWWCRLWRQNNWAPVPMMGTPTQGLPLHRHRNRSRWLPSQAPSHRKCNWPIRILCRAAVFGACFGRVVVFGLHTYVRTNWVAFRNNTQSA